MKHIDPSSYPALQSDVDPRHCDDRTIVLVTISRYRGEDAISRIKSVLPGSEIINLSQLYVDRDVTDMAAAPVSAPAPMPTPVSLTHRQREILNYLLNGLSNKEIGRKLGLSHFTVRNHVSNILRTLGFPCRRAMRRSLNAGAVLPAFPTSMAA